MSSFYKIILLIGPSNSGKSYFYNNVLKPQITKSCENLKEPLRLVYLSSDEIRRQLLGFEAHKMSDEMMAVSPEAFRVLFDRLNISTSYPHNAHFVVVDSTGLSEDFRNQVLEVGRNNNYSVEAIVFDYKEMDEYLQNIKEDNYSYLQKKVTIDHIKRLRQDVLKTLSKKHYSQVTKIKSFSDMSNYSFTCDVEQYNSHVILNETHTVIGDIHGCFDDFINLLLKLKVEIKDGKIIAVPPVVGKLVLIGDLIDKGFDSGKVVEFVYDNLSHFVLIQGNHEHWVVAECQKSSGLDEDFKKEYFNSFYELSNEQKDKLKIIYSKALNFAKNSHFILTHAPCEKKYLGKFDSQSQKLMRKTPYMKSKKDFSSSEEFIKYSEEKFQYLQTEKNRNHPLHVFGHKTFPRAMKWDNKVAIDSGAVYGGYLTALTINQHGRINFTSLKTTEKVPYSSDGIVAPFCEKEVKQIELSEFDKQRVEILAKNKVQFISGTIAPADKDLSSNELESLANGLYYYKNHGVKEVVLQTKHMGSRCNIYLHEDLTQCRAVSRNGFLVKLDLSSVFTKLQLKFADYMKKNQVNCMVLDGELMPWSALGKGLIQEQYEVVGHAVKSEIEALKEAGFDVAFNQISNHEKRREFDLDVNTLSKNKMIDKYGYQLYHSLAALKKVKLNLESDENHIDEYLKQVSLYGQEKEINFLPFMLLKTIHKNGSEKVFISETEKTKDNYQLVSDLPFEVINLDSPDALVKAQKFFDTQVSKGEEGIVIKPEFTFHKNLAPFIKVRNKEYLRIIYGYNYLEPEIYNDLVKSKKVQKKMKVSSNEYLIAKKMLEILVSDISADNEVYITLISQMIAEEQEEQKIDYRL